MFLHQDIKEQSLEDSSEQSGEVLAKHFDSSNLNFRTEKHKIIFSDTSNDLD